MTAIPQAATIGLFADGPVGAAVMKILVERCPERLLYVVTPSADSVVAKSHAALSLKSELMNWSVNQQREPLPRHRDSAPELVLLAWWPHLVRRDFLAAGQSATLNMHPSLLPYGRGKDPNFWALADGDPFGVTIHHVDEGIDTGPIAFQAPLATGWTDTGGTLYAKAQAELIALFSASLDAMLSMDIPRLPQQQHIGSFHKRADLMPRSVIDLDASYTGRELLNLLRARTFATHPACRFSDHGQSYEVQIEIAKIEEQT